MIIKKIWYGYNKVDGFKISKKYIYKGYFLFGFIPLYIERINV